MATKKKYYDGDIPFDKNGNQMHYADPSPYASRFYGADKWVPNCEFRDVLTYVQYHRGRSAAYFEFQRTVNPGTVFVFMTDFEVMIPKMVGGKVAGNFTFCKRGANFGCQMVLDGKRTT